MKKIVVSMEFDVNDMVQEIIEWRESCEWVNSHGETGGHPRSLSVTINDVLEQIVEYIVENTEAWDETTAVVAGRGRFMFRDEHGNSLNTDLTLTDNLGNVLV